MKKFLIAISTNNITASVRDYTLRLGCQPCVVADNQYALWRTETINISVREDLSCKPGELRHLGWEGTEALRFTSATDVNDIVWEHFSAEQQAGEIEDTWRGTGYMPTNDFQPPHRGCLLVGFDHYCIWPLVPAVKYLME